MFDGPGPKHKPKQKEISVWASGQKLLNNLLNVWAAEPKQKKTTLNMWAAGPKLKKHV